HGGPPADLRLVEPLAPPPGFALRCPRSAPQASGAVRLPWLRISMPDRPLGCARRWVEAVNISRAIPASARPYALLDSAARRVRGSEPADATPDRRPRARPTAPAPPAVQPQRHCAAQGPRHAPPHPHTRTRGRRAARASCCETIRCWSRFYCAGVTTDSRRSALERLL